MISFESTARFRACVSKEKLPLEAVFVAMQRTASVWGRPHLHGGQGIRRLTAGTYECRLDRDTRLLFLVESGTLIFDFAGNHDQVKAYLKNRR